MKKIPAIKKFMTPFPYSVHTDAELTQALKIMDEHGIHHLPVTDQGEIVGIISSRDISRRQEYDESALTIKDVMLAETYTVDLSERLDSVLHRMAEHHLDAVIVTRKGRLAGIFTHVDACAAFAEYLREQVRRSGGDSAA